MTVENISINVRTNAGDAASQLRSLSSALGGVSNAASNSAASTASITSAMNGTVGAAKSASSAIRSVGKAASDAGKEADAASKGGLSRLLSSFKRIMMYRAIRAILKTIAQAIKDGVNNLYEWSRAVGELDKMHIKATLDDLASSWTQLKNTLGIFAMQILTAIKPILDILIQTIIEVINAVNWLIAVLGGKGTYLKAVKGMTEYSEATDKANKSGQELKKTLLGFDEINRLNGPGGGGGASGTPDNLFEPTSTGIGNIDISGLTDKIGMLPPFVSRKLGEVRETVLAFVAELELLLGNNKVPQLAEGLVVSITEPFFSPRLSGLVQPVITALALLELALSKSRIPQLASNIVNAIQSTLNRFTSSVSTQFAKATQTVVQWASESEQTVSTATARIAEFVQTNFEKAGQSIASFARNAIASASQWAVETERNAISACTTVQISVETAFRTALGKINSFVENSITSLQKWGQRVPEFVQPAAQTVKESVSAGFSNAKQNVTEFVTKTSSAVGAWASSVATSFSSAMSSAAQSVYDGLLSAWSNVNAFVLGAAAAIGSFASSAATSVATAFQSVVNSIATALSKLWENFKNLMKGVGKSVNTAFEARTVMIGGVVTYVPPQVDAVTLMPAIIGAGAFGAAGAGAAAIPAFSEGGFPDAGSLFVAGEAGAEFVGNVGGRTGVVNTDQMAESVAAGNVEVVSAIIQMANAIVKAVNDKDTDITLDGQSLAQQLYPYTDAYANRRGSGLVTIGGTV